jgi:hypothetical protein
LAALALDPTSQAAFDALRTAPPPGKFFTHVVLAGDSCGSVADLYYRDRSRCENIELFNGLKPGAPLVVGRSIKIPEIPGVPIVLP